jgi:hypothetical protein
MILCAALVAGCNGDGSSSDPSADSPSSGSTNSGAAGNVTPVQNSAVTLSWQPPTENTNGSALTDLSGYVINYGTQSGSYTSSITVTNPGLATYVVDNLSPGTYYFSVTATASDGTVSPPSPEVSATVE